MGRQQYFSIYGSNKNNSGEISESGTYTIPASMVPTATPNAGYSNGTWDQNPTGAIVNIDTTFTLKYTPISAPPVIQPTP